MTTSFIINQLGERSQMWVQSWLVRFLIKTKRCTRWIFHWDLSWVQCCSILSLLTQMADQEIGSSDLETKEVLYFVSSSKDKSGIQNASDKLETWTENFRYFSTCATASPPSGIINSTDKIGKSWWGRNSDRKGYRSYRWPQTSHELTMTCCCKHRNVILECR